mmetsp:Transcript_24766/g.48725  ORF Transcript_24766/g.48725 Transcript_24766/m.48725 type:complete len:216 (-) Transcript_24766:474-1121(-)
MDRPRPSPWTRLCCRANQKTWRQRSTAIPSPSQRQQLARLRRPTRTPAAATVKKMMTTRRQETISWLRLPPQGKERARCLCLSPTSSEGWSARRRSASRWMVSTWTCPTSRLPSSPWASRHRTYPECTGTTWWTCSASSTRSTQTIIRFTTCASNVSTTPSISRGGWLGSPSTTTTLALLTRSCPSARTSKSGWVVATTEWWRSIAKRARAGQAS